MIYNRSTLASPDRRSWIDVYSVFGRVAIVSIQEFDEDDTLVRTTYLHGFMRKRRLFEKLDGVIAAASSSLPLPAKKQWPWPAPTVEDAGYAYLDARDTSLF